MIIAILKVGRAAIWNRTLLDYIIPGGIYIDIRITRGGEPLMRMTSRRIVHEIFNCLLIQYYIAVRRAIRKSLILHFYYLIISVY